MKVIKKWFGASPLRILAGGATTMFISEGGLSQGDHFVADLSKCRCCLPACASRRDAFHEATTSWRQKDELIYYGCALLTMNSINDLRNI